LLLQQRKRFNLRLGIMGFALAFSLAIAVVNGFGRFPYALILPSMQAWQKPMARWWPTRTFAMASLCTAAGTALPLLARHEWVLMISVILVGGSFFMVPASVVAYNRKTLPQSQWAMAMSAYTTLFAVGQAIGPVVAGEIADRLGMNQSMLFGAVLLMLGAGIVLLDHAQRRIKNT
jgi:predicted MFS family arabinose efflux permease